MSHFLIAGKGYIGSVHADVAPLPAKFIVRHPTGAANETTDFEKALSEKPLFLDICTPNISHIDYALRAAEYNLPVYCEKPLSATLCEAEQMEKAFSEKTLTTGVAFNYRFLPAVTLLKQVLEADTLGKIIYYKGSFLHDSYLLPRGDVWRVKATAGGGALGDLGVHLFDLCRYLFGESKITHCESHIEFPERTEVDEYARCTLQSALGKGFLEISRISAGRSSENGIEVFGHKGSARILFEKPYELELFDISTKEKRILSADKALCDTLGYPDKKQDIGFFYGSHKASLAAFINKLDGIPSPVLADFADGLAAQKMLDDALKLSKK